MQAGTYFIGRRTLWLSRRTLDLEVFLRSPPLPLGKVPDTNDPGSGHEPNDIAGTEPALAAGESGKTSTTVGLAVMPSSFLTRWRGVVAPCPTLSKVAPKIRHDVIITLLYCSEAQGVDDAAKLLDVLSHGFEPLHCELIRELVHFGGFDLRGREARGTAGARGQEQPGCHTCDDAGSHSGTAGSKGRPSCCFLRISRIVASRAMARPGERGWLRKPESRLSLSP